jgi:hypothetical protein
MVAVWWFSVFAVLPVSLRQIASLLLMPEMTASDVAALKRSATRFSSALARTRPPCGGALEHQRAQSPLTSAD